MNTSSFFGFIRESPVFYAGDDVRAAKLEKLQLQMTEDGLDGLLVLRPEGIRYATDFYAKGYRTFLEIEYCLVMDRTGRQSLAYTSGSDDIRVRLRSFLGDDDVRSLSGGPEDWHPTVAAMLSDYGLSKARVGYDLMPVELFVALQQHLPDLELVPAGGLWEKVSAIKHPLEVDCMREAFRVICAGITAGVNAVRPGIREIDVAAEMEYVMRREGNEMFPAITMVAAGPNAAIFERVATHREIQQNELVILDLTGVVNGYSADAARTVIAGGQASSAQREIYETCRLALANAIEACRVGATCGDVDAAARRGYDSSAWGRYGSRWATGHQIGFGLHGTPLVAAGNNAKLKRGMVMCLEPRLQVFDQVGIGGVQLEDAVLITDADPEVLTAALPYWNPDA